MSTTINKNKIKCAVFDLDGTLLNTIYTINYYLNLALERNGLGRIDKDRCASFVGDGAVKLIERALDSLGANKSEMFDKVFADYNTLYDSAPDYLTEIYDGIPAMLDTLKEQGIALAVLSNKPDFATKATVEKFFPGVFTIVRGSKQGVPLKPAPDALYSIISELGFTPADVAYVGDSQQDVKIAANAEVALGISVDWGFRSRPQLADSGAKLIVNTPSDVVNAIFN